jgi:hypothetical protein
VNTAQLIERVYQHLQDNHLRYPESEVVGNGLNPAQDLLLLFNPTVLHRRTLCCLPACAQFTDLRIWAPRLLTLLRVVRGDVSADRPDAPSGWLFPLESTRLCSFSTDLAWMSREGEPTRYFRHGRYLLGVWPRPRTETHLTLIYESLAERLSLDAPEGCSELPQEMHPVIADLAAQLLLMKEGSGETDRALSQMQSLLGAETMTLAVKRMHEMRRDAPSGSPAIVEELA